MVDKIRTSIGYTCIALFERYERYENEFNHTTPKNKMVPDLYEQNINHRIETMKNTKIVGVIISVSGLL